MEARDIAVYNAKCKQYLDQFRVTLPAKAANVDIWWKISLTPSTLRNSIKFEPKFFDCDLD